MKKQVWFITGLIILCSTSMATAHPPTAISINDTNGSMLIIDVEHPVGGDKDHFINSIKIYKNGELIITQVTSQQETQNLTLTYRVPSLKVGDIIKVEAKCNIAGSLEAEYRIRK
ncbi:MAG: hypothetical protein K8S27_09795 [Candidatus Omnitrophica bacterium]|nr:hypothetical protein [Candidatus Omnitrophota bacterium]